LGDRWLITFSRNLAPDFTHYLTGRPEMTPHDEASKKAKTVEGILSNMKNRKRLNLRNTTQTTNKLRTGQKMKMTFAKARFYLSARFSLILLAGWALTFALFGSGVAVAQARKGAETIQTSQDLSAAPLPGGSYSGDGPLGEGHDPYGVPIWALLAVGDFNGDSKPDYVLINGNTSQTAIWYMNNNVFVSGAFGPTLPP
jgi:hypothetical protein